MRFASRALVALSAFIMATGSILHGLAYPKAAGALSRSDLPPFFADAYRGLWWSDSACSLVMALVFSLLAARPESASRPLACLLSLIPLATALSIYWALGHFYPGDLLVVASASALLGALLGGETRPGVIGSEAASQG
jgi:hypothetical protein